MKMCHIEQPGANFYCPSDLAAKSHEKAFSARIRELYARHHQLQEACNALQLGVPRPMV